MLDASTAAGRAQKFPLATSTRISLSSVRSATSVLLLQFLQAHGPVRLQAVKFLAPAIVRLVRHRDRPDRFAQRSAAADSAAGS
jgi:hypothetical protein